MGRDDFDIVRVLVDAVGPALAAVFKPGEVQSVHLDWEDPVTLPDGTQSMPTELNVHLVCKGESHTSNLWTGGMWDYDGDQIREHLVMQFSDFVAESQFGWGQQR
jgi:hypothetical protein